MEAYLHMRIILKNVRLSLRNVSVEIGVHSLVLELNHIHRGRITASVSQSAVVD